MQSYSDFKPKIVLGVVAHPDDLEFGAAGTIAKWAAQGVQVYYYVLTGGERGSSDPDEAREHLITTRQSEQRKAARILGVTDVFFGEYEDATMCCNQDVQRDIVRVIRKLQPDTVITMDPTEAYSTDLGMLNHPDHRAVGQAALDAIYPLARDCMSFPELARDGLKPHRVERALLINTTQSNYTVDISEQIELKKRALQAHASQMNEGLLKMILAYNQRVGTPHSYNYAEAFMRIDLSF